MAIAVGWRRLNSLFNRVGRTSSHRVLSFLPIAAVAAALLSDLLLIPGPPHLSLQANQSTIGEWRVSHVMPGGLGWDAGIKPGFFLLEYKGGILDSRESPVLRDPISATVLDPKAGLEFVADARELAPTAGLLRVLLWILASSLACMAFLAMSARPWDLLSHRLLLLFGLLATALAVGNFSGTKGGVAPLWITAAATSGTGYAVVAFAHRFPHGRSFGGWGLKYVLRGFSGGALLVAIMFLAGYLTGNPLYEMARISLGVYLALSLIGTGTMLVWSYWKRPARAERVQLLLLLVVFTLGLGPAIVVQLVPQLFNLRQPALSVDVGAAFLTILPIGITFIILQFQFPKVHRTGILTLIPATIFLGSFLIVFLSNEYLAVTSDSSTLLRFLAALVSASLMAAIGVALLAIVRLTPVPSHSGGFIPVGMLEERRRIIKEFHDGPTQTAQALTMMIGLNQSITPEIREYADKLVDQMRQILILTEVGLPGPNAKDFEQALDDLAVELQKISPLSVKVIVRHHDHAFRLQDTAAHELYGAAKEALANVVKHSHATEAIVRLEYRSQQIILSVDDNGNGFDASDWERHIEYFGLSGTRWRLQQIGGSLSVKSTKGAGTTFTAVLQLTSTDTLA